VDDFARESKDRASTRDALEERLRRDGADGKGEASLGARRADAEAASKKLTLDLAKAALEQRRQSEVQTGKLGVDLAIESNNLRNQSRLAPTAVRTVAGRQLLECGGVWIDDGFEGTMATLTVKAQSPAYFRLLDRQPRVKDVFRLGNHLLWVTPSGTALVIDTTGGKEELTDAEIDRLFDAKK
jgi:Ca-activated chloride channel family protein